MELKRVKTAGESRRFFTVPEEIYRGNHYYRDTEKSIVKLLVTGPSAYRSHAVVNPYLFLENGKVVGRCALIHDANLRDTVQVAFFEAQHGLKHVAETIKKEARKCFPETEKLVVGLNGHLNYGAGLLLNRYNDVPLFGLSYSQPYYPDYFARLHCRQTLTYRFPLEPIFKWMDAGNPSLDPQGITTRFMNKSKLVKEIEQYTCIDNTSFTNTKYWYWSNRQSRENYELFHPFARLMDSENLIFAEKNGKPVGFLLWYPDFNMLTGPARDLTIFDVVKFRCNNPITTIRFTEVALLPEFRKSPAVMLMIMKMIEPVRKAGYSICEGGFIFEENMDSRVMTRRLLERACGASVEPYRRFGIFEDTL